MPRERHRRAVSAAPAAVRHRLTNRTKPAYKVVLEQVTQQKKKLIVVGSSRPQPPPGYTFIPAGDPQITNRCKHLARLDGAKVYVVSTTRHKHGLSNQVHRIGYHFPSSVVARACTSLGINLSRDGHVLHQHHGWTALEAPKQRHGKIQKTSGNALAKTQLSQATVDTLAREAIKDLFPNIPPKDLHEIVIHAFELGTTRVGNAGELSLPRRVQLAVVAHIRHNYTDYDKLLKQVPYQVARAMIEQASLDKLAQWRGDDGEEPNAMEDILREVIVIPDDDEEDNIESIRRSNSRQGSVEILSSRAIADGLETRPIDYATERSLAMGVDSPDSDDVQEVTFLGHGQYAFDTPNERRDARNGAHRHRAWEQARHRLRQPDGQAAALSPTIARRLVERPRLQRVDFARSDTHIAASPGAHQDRQFGSHNVTHLQDVFSHIPNTANGTGNLYTNDSNLDLRDSNGGVYYRLSSTNTFEEAESHNLSKPINRKSRHPVSVLHEESARTRQSIIDDLEPNHVSSAYMSPRLRNSPRGQRLEIQSPSRDSSRVECVAQSIETPVHDTSRSFHPVSVNHALSSSYDYRIGNVDSENWNNSSMAQQNFDGVQQITKRRRIEETDSRPLRQHNEPSNLQRTLLIPIKETKRPEALARQSAVFHRIEEREPAVMRTNSHGARPAQTVVHLVERDDSSSYVCPTESDHGVSFRTDLPHQRQIFISPQTPQSRMFPATVFEIPSERPASEHIRHESIYTFPHTSSAPYISLPREAPYASRFFASGSDRQAAPGAAGNGHSQNYNAVFGQTSKLGSSLVSEETQPRNWPENMIERPPHLPTYNRQPESSVDRARRPLPLDRFFEELNPTWKNIPVNEVSARPYRNTNMNIANSTDMMDESRNPLNPQTIYTRDGLSGAKPVNYIQYESHRPPDGSIQHENRFRKPPQRYNGEYSSVRQMPPRVVHEMREPVIHLSTYDRMPKRAFDQKTGKEVIVLE